MRSVRGWSVGVVAIGGVGLLALGPAASARSVATLPWPDEIACSSVLDVSPKEPQRDLERDGDAMRAIRALDARTRVEHERLLQDTQSLADEADGLVRENAARVTEITRLKAEIAAVRAAVAALRAVPR